MEEKERLPSFKVLYIHSSSLRGLHCGLFLHAAAAGGRRMWRVLLRSLRQENRGREESLVILGSAIFQVWRINFA